MVLLTLGFFKVHLRIVHYNYTIVHIGGNDYENINSRRRSSLS